MGILKALLTVEDESEDESAASPEEISKQKLEAALDRVIAEHGQAGPREAAAVKSGSTVMALDLHRTGGVTKSAVTAQGSADTRPAAMTLPRTGGFGRRTQRPA